MPLFLQIHRVAHIFGPITEKERGGGGGGGLGVVWGLFYVAPQKPARPTGKGAGGTPATCHRCVH